jgi:hypothetical protein
MSEKRFAGLTIEQLNSAGAAAGTDAVSQAHAAGLAAPGMTNLRLASGEERKVLTRLHPDGTLEIVEECLRFDAKNSALGARRRPEKFDIQAILGEHSIESASSIYAMAKTVPQKISEQGISKKSKPAGSGRS